MASTFLLGLIVVPLVAAAVVAALGAKNVEAVRRVSLIAVLVNLALNGLVLAKGVPLLQAREPLPSFVPLEDFTTQINLLPLDGSSSAAIQFFIGLDGLNVWLVTLTSVLMLPSVLVSWEAVKERVNEYYAWLLVLQAAMTGVFLAFDLVLFYVFFELTLVPLFFLIGIWGGPMRREASRKFFLYTLAGSLITLLGAIGAVLACYQLTARADDAPVLTFSIPLLITEVQKLIDKGLFTSGMQLAIFLALSVGFAVKVPLFPLHTWLPLAHVEAPTAGSVLLAGVLLKLGTYGFLRLCLPLAPDAVLSVGVPLIGTLAAIGIVYGALCAYAQPDIKKLVAYSSVSHLGFCMLGLFALNTAGLTGGLLQMINHGLSTGGLFLLVGMLYERYHTRMMADYSGMAARLKLLSAFMVFICLTSVGMPGLNGFVGEMLVLAGVYDLKGASVSGTTFAVVVAIGIVLGAWYLFTMLMRVFFGPLREPEHEGHAVEDLNGRELATILPVAVLCVVLGVYPQPVIDAAKADLAVVSAIADRARDRATKAAQTATARVVDPTGSIVVADDSLRK